MRYGLIFDVDGVIADSEKVNAIASIRVFRDLFGVYDVQREDFEAGLGRGAEAYVRAAAEVHGIDLTHEQVAAATSARQANFLKILGEGPLQPFPGVLELMNSASAHNGISVAIATSSAREKSEAVLQSARIPYQRFVYVTGNDVRNKKPDPELFLLAARRMNIRPENCAVIEDAPNGIQAAHAAGCMCIAITNSASAEKLSQADLVVSTLTEVSVRDIIAILQGRERPISNRTRRSRS